MKPLVAVAILAPIRESDKLDVACKMAAVGGSGLLIVIAMELLVGCEAIVLVAVLDFDDDVL